jgi:ABC-type multidrug transport system fused ATPase/permease subunit
MEMTVRENLLFANIVATDDEMTNVLQAASVNFLPQGLDTMLDSKTQSSLQKS